jgi:hypothetical protein
MIDLFRAFGPHWLTGGVRVDQALFNGLARFDLLEDIEAI